jgi:hypothetical protein
MESAAPSTGSQSIAKLAIEFCTEVRNYGSDAFEWHFAARHQPVCTGLSDGVLVITLSQPGYFSRALVRRK